MVATSYLLKLKNQFGPILTLNSRCLHFSWLPFLVKKKLFYGARCTIKNKTEKAFRLVGKNLEDQTEDHFGELEC